MKPARFEYIRPSDVVGALAVSQETPESKFIAGGQSLGPMLNLRLARPAALIDISRLPELRDTQENGSTWILGGATTHSEIEDGRTVLGRSGMLPEVARQIGYRAIRNRGTIGGSVAHADAAADWPLALSAIQASIRLRNLGGSRTIPIGHFLKSAFTTAIQDNEILLSIEIPKPTKGARWGYYKVCRKVGEFPIASAAIVLDDDGCRAFLGALSDKPRSMPLLESEIARTRTVPPVSMFVAAVNEAAPELDALDRRMFIACIARAANEALAR